MLSQLFKPITTARHQMTMKEIACASQRVERRFSINIVDRAGVRLVKTIKTWEGRGVGVVTFIGRGGWAGRNAN